MVKVALKTNATFLNELIWREFFMQILYNFPKVIHANFKSKYDQIVWRNNEEEFEECKGEAETLAGFVLEISGNFPKKNQKIPFKEYWFTIESLDKRRIKQVKVTRKNELEDA